ncbi:unnamed protein product [marine sediment metagenome]|uniref:Homing endonuclease LAGLIDADG domain-containing protein n=1 Tax=marine sediment metagenome TaxID=412755 RepID=X1LMS8_9ZZZZ
MESRAVTLELLGTNEQEVAYIAGLFDGEGWISAKSEHLLPITSRKIVTGIKMSTPEPMLFCSRIFGGQVRPRQTKPRCKQLHEWLLWAKKAEVFLRVIEPYLIVKKDKANLALAFLACPRGISPKKLELAELITPHIGRKLELPESP